MVLEFYYYDNDEGETRFAKRFYFGEPKGVHDDQEVWPGPIPRIGETIGLMFAAELPLEEGDAYGKVDDVCWLYSSNGDLRVDVYILRDRFSIHRELPDDERSPYSPDFMIIKKVLTSKQFLFSLLLGVTLPIVIGFLIYLSQ